MPRTPSTLFVLALASSAQVACSGGHTSTSDAGPLPDAPTAPDVQGHDAAPDVPFVYDAGPAPACSVTATATHIVDRPGGDRVAEPSAIVALPSGGFLVGLRHVDLNPPDGGVTDGAVIPTSRDSIDVLALGPDGAPRGPATTVFDGASAGNRTNGPVLVPNPAGGFVLFQEAHGMAGDPTGFLLRLRGGVVDATGAGAMPAVIRDDFTLPQAAALTSGDVFGIGSRISNPTDAGAVTASPASMLLLPDGGNARSSDVDIASILPFDVTDGLVRANDAGGAVYVFRTGGHPGFLSVSPDGVVSAHGPYTAASVTVPAIDDAAATSTAVYAVFAHQAGSGGMIEVHAVVMDAATGASRGDVTLETYAGTAEPATVVPAYGGAVVLWKRGGDADARVRAAVVQPDGIVRVAATDLVAAPHADGRVVAVADGRVVSFVMRDGQAPAWGYTFGQACLPASGM